jgi:hypothetical protein
LPPERLPLSCWTEPTSDFSAARNAPAIAIERRTAAGEWTALLLDGIAETDDGARIVYGIDAVAEDEARACAIWLPPAAVPNGVYRFSVRTAGGAIVKLEEFEYPR